MKIGKLLSVIVVGLASLIVISAGAIAIASFAFSRGSKQQNVSPPDGQQAISPTGDALLFSKSSGSSSFLYRKAGASGKGVRLTRAMSGIESEPSFSHSGRLVVYSFADSPDSRSSIWIVGIDGSNPHAVTRESQDAMHPVFSPDDSEIFFGASSFNGHYSPVVRPARHDWDVFSVPVQATAGIAGAAPTQITHESFYAMQSLDAVRDSINPGEASILISTTGYPIGALIEQFGSGASGRKKIFQPHVQGEPSFGPAFGDARFGHDGMDVLFLAATNSQGGNYDYNVYSMSDVTGGEIKQLTHLKGMTKNLRVLPGNKAIFENGGTIYLLDIEKQTTEPI